MPRPARVTLAVVCTTAAGLLAAVPGVSGSAAATTTTPAGDRVLAVSSPDLGLDRIGLRRGGSWYLDGSLGPGTSRSYAEERQGDQPVAGDTDGNGDDSVSLFRAGLWMVRDNERGSADTFTYGSAGDTGVLGDWDGDGKDTVGVFHAGTWSLRDSNHSSAGVARTTFGQRGDRAFAGDFDGDGRTDLGLMRGNRFYLRTVSGRDLGSFTFGRSGDLPVAGDWDHDGRDTVGTFHRGTWTFRGNSGASQQVVFGQTGDLPVVRRVRGLAPGVTHQVVRDTAGPFTAHVLRVQLSAVSSPTTVLAGDRVGALEPTSAMGRRTRAVAAVNGDYFLSSGRPVHAFAADGRLRQTEQLRGRGVGLGADGTTIGMGFPTVTARLQVPGGAPATVARWDSGGPSGDELAAYTAQGPQRPDGGRCYVLLEPLGHPTVASDGSVQRTERVRMQRCSGTAVTPSSTGTVLVALPGSAGAKRLARLTMNQQVVLTSQLGFAGTADLIGGTPQLVVNGGYPPASDIDGSGGFFARQPRTAVGVTSGGTLLVVVVDGRRSGTTGATLREMADLMMALGAKNAMNLDGGGSSTMYLNGLVANQPSDGVERGVGSALVVLPGADPNQDFGTPAATSPQPTGGGGLPPLPLGTGYRGESTDPGSTGGLLDALQTSGTRLPPALRQVAEQFRLAAR